MRILITGGAGFIGSHLANELQRRGHFVRVLDDLSGGDPARLHDGVNFNRGDVRDLPRLWSLLQGVDVVFHLAALVSVPASVLYPREYNDVNVGGTVTLLEACRDVGSVRRVVLASSGTVYGDHSRQPVYEAMETRPAVPYAVSKVSAEQYLFTIGRLSHFETVALRIFNAYGPGQPLPPAHPPVIPQVMQQVLGKGSVVVYGDGSQTRDFVYIDDVVDALISASLAPNVDRQIVNVGSGVETSVNALVEAISAITGLKANVLYNHESTGGLARLVADLSRAKELLNYRPRTQLEVGLRKLLEMDPIFAKSKRKLPKLLPTQGQTVG
ncbi:MAG: NAD-dependent epimerase/dehydratase family protein [Caldilineaceae bacterium]|nr:NAD-dependent epimerase/dehydratase family protein [Caldilineaceae bacterium]